MHPLNLILVIPATNAVSERSASALRRVKTSTMTQVRLDNLLILRVHKRIADDLDIAACLNEFVSDSEHRLSVFGNLIVNLAILKCIVL